MISDTDQSHRAAARAVFFDKDGTLVEDVPYNVDLGRIVLREGALGCLQRLHAAGFKIVIISNQSGVAHGMFSLVDVELVGEFLRGLLAAAGVPLAGFHYCPHHVGGSIERYARSCDCRKPAPGLLHEAAHLHGIDLARSWMIGDILHDVEAGNRAGCGTILLDVGNETEWDLPAVRRPHHIVSSLSEVADIILHAEQPHAPPQDPSVIASLS